jgi:hypothetical protein
MVVILMMAFAGIAFGAISPEEAAKLGTTLTGVGAEKVGNKDGTIPPYIGGLTTPPASYKPGSGNYTDPFAGEKPLFSINAQNMNQYANRLTEGTKTLMKRFPTYRIDVYKTHRTAAFPDSVIKNTATNAVKTTTYNGGLSMKGAHAGYPFPIPKDGYEAMWNHLVLYSGRAYEWTWKTFVVDASGRLINTSVGTGWDDFPYYDEKGLSKSDEGIYYKTRWLLTGPPRSNGEAGQLKDPINMYEQGRVAYQYLPGQRRIKLAPEIGFDSPGITTLGASTFDEIHGFNGSMDRYNMKLIGKKEVYVPYNTYKASYQTTANELFGTKHQNPDVVRWELHRVWVVEGTLRPGKRHIYAKRVFYLDEDSWAILAGENYDAHGFLFKAFFNHQAPLYDIPSVWSFFVISYNTISGVYYADHWPGKNGYVRRINVFPEREWSPSRLTGIGVR